MGELTTDAAPIPEGEVLAGKYRLGRVLGQGGMGVVVAATHVQLDQRVALKFLRAETLGNPEVVARFTREAQAAARIRGVHVARVLDVGELPSGAPYIVMEYLEGEDLECVLRRGPLPIAQAVDLLLQGCEAVAEAHTLGIVHRDLKPANLFLARYPGGRQIVKVLDFGISKLQGPTGDPRLTKPASMFGSPPYMAPEQLRSARAADVRSDIWSLGAVLYELLTQTTPFPTESMQALFAAILLEAPAPPRALREEIPPALEAAIIRCLEKDPSKRFQDVASLAAALGPFGSASSAEVPGRIAHIMSMAVTGMALSAPAMAEGVVSPLAAAGKLEGLPTIESRETSQRIVAPTAAGRSGPPVPDAAPAPVDAKAPPASVPWRSRGSRRFVLALALTMAGAIATTAAAYWLRGRTFPQGTGTPSAPPATPARIPAPSPPPPPSKALASPAAPPAVLAPLPPAVVSASPASPASPSPEPRRPAGTATRPHEQATPAGVGPAAPSVCADLLARQSLGETLTPEESSTYVRACKKQ